MALQQIFLSRAALRQNITVLRQRAASAQLWPCVKANAYGHGLEPIVTSIDEEVDGYCVVSTAEAIKLRRLTDKPILVLNNVEKEHVLICAQQQITLPLASMQQQQWYAQCPETVSVHVELDSGMARTGWVWSDPSEAEAWLNQVPSNIRIVGFFSHYAAAGEDEAFSQRQRVIFESFTNVFAQSGLPNLLFHIDKSAPLFSPQPTFSQSSPSLLSQRSMLIRPGIALYGLPVAGVGQPTELQPVLSWKTTVMSMRSLEPGQPVGYGLTFVAHTPTHIATLPIGYADGYPRALSNVADVLINGQRCRVRGRICMNLTMVEVPETVRVGNEVVLIGQQGNEVITARELADHANTTHYEIVTRLNPEIERVVVEV